MRDTLVVLNEFSNKIVDALNKAGVEGLVDDETAICAVLVVVGNPEAEAPLGASLNYEPKTKTWSVLPEVSVSQPYNEQ